VPDLPRQAGMLRPHRMPGAAKTQQIVSNSVGQRRRVSLARCLYVV